MTDLPASGTGTWLSGSDRIEIGIEDLLAPIRSARTEEQTQQVERDTSQAWESLLADVRIRIGMTATARSSRRRLAL